MFKLVPVDPTSEMLQAANAGGIDTIVAMKAWIRMIQAAPAPECGVVDAARRVIAAFEANGKSNNFDINIHRECEASMLALKAALGGNP